MNHVSYSLRILTHRDWMDASSRRHCQHSGDIRTSTEFKSWISAPTISSSYMKRDPVRKGEIDIGKIAQRSCGTQGQTPHDLALLQQIKSGNLQVNESLRKICHYEHRRTNTFGLGRGGGEGGGGSGDFLARKIYAMPESGGSNRDANADLHHFPI